MRFAASILALLLATASSVHAQRVANQPSPRDADRVPRLVAESDLRLWSAGISNVDVDAEGNIYAFHDRDMQIRMYDSAGQLLRTVGRRGREPGQFTSAAKIGVAGDTVWAIEGGWASGLGSRITLYRRDGTVLGAHPIVAHPIGLQRVDRIEGLSEETLTVGFLGPMGMLTDGTFISEMRERLVRGPEAGANTMFAGAADTVLIPRLVFDVRGAILDTLGMDRRPPPSPAVVHVLKIGEVEFGAPSPPSDRTLKVTTIDGSIFVDRRIADAVGQAEFVVRRVNLSGDTVDRARFTYTPRPYTESMLEDRAMYRNAFGVVASELDGITILSRVGGPNRRPLDSEMDTVRNASRAAMRFPRFQPPVQGHFIGKDGGLWLSREDDETDAVRWLVLDQALDAVGEVVLPRDVRPMWSSGNTFWATVNDTEEVGVVWLTRYHLHPS